MKKLQSLIIALTIAPLLFSLAAYGLDVSSLTQEELAEVAKISNGDGAGVVAVVKLANQTLLADVVCNANADNIRNAAFNKLADQSALAVVAKKTEIRDFQERSVQKITDQNILADIARNAPDPFARYYAIKELTEQTTLADIAKNENETTWPVRLCAIKRLTDQSILSDIAKNDKDADVRSAAIKKIADLRAPSEDDKTPKKKVSYDQYLKTQSQQSSDNMDNHPVRTIKPKNVLANQYLALLVKRLREAHEKPNGVSDLLNAEVMFRINTDGTFSDLKIRRSSGNKEFDRSVLDAFKRVATIAPPLGVVGSQTAVFRMKE